MRPFRDKPLETPGMPPGIFNIIGNEAAERFSFYGMRVLLVVFMTKYLMDGNGNPSPMNEAEAKTWYHLFTSSVYFVPFFGALLADVFFGKYRVIMALSMVYCLGHGVLALDDTRSGLLAGLSLIALGSGGIKPCVSAHVGDQFGTMNRGLMDKTFSWFYLAINFGAFISMLLTPKLLEHYGPQVAFAVPGIAMLVATIVFWMGRNKFAHIPAGGTAYIKEIFNRDNLGRFARIGVVFAFVPMFWALYDQSGSAWVLQAEHMNRNIFGIELLAEQVQIVNPVMILVLSPFFAYLVYPRLGRLADNPLKKILIGFVVMTGSFVITAWVESQIAAGLTPTIWWHIFAYVVLTSAEVLVAIPLMEFAYAQASKNTKSTVMGFELLTVSAGNLFTAGVNWFIQNEDGTTKITGVQYYEFFALVMLATAVFFFPVVFTYRKPAEIVEGEPAV